MNDRTTLAENIERGWTKRGYKSMRSFALAAGVNPDTLRSIMRGISKNSRGDTLGKISAALGVGSNDLTKPDLVFPDAPAQHADGVLAGFTRRGTVKHDIGRRMAFIRTTRTGTDSPNVSADRLGWDVADLLAYESGDKQLVVDDLIDFCNGFTVSVEFVLFGVTEGLDPQTRMLWQASPR